MESKCELVKIIAMHCIHVVVADYDVNNAKLYDYPNIIIFCNVHCGHVNYRYKLFELLYICNLINNKFLIYFSIIFQPHKIPTVLCLVRKAVDR